MNPDTIIFIHEYLTAFFRDSEDPISPPGIKNIDQIESSAGRPLASAGGQDAYPTIFLKAAAMFHSIACNHGFHNGNKRAALLSTLYYLSEFGYWVDRCDDEEMYEFTRQIAAHEIADERANEVQVIAEWLERNSRRQQKGEHQLKFHDLRDILARFGFDLIEDGMLALITRNGEIIDRVRKKGMQGFEDYDPQYISGVRKRLDLIPENGIDSARFYGQKGISEDLNEFMRMRIEVMKKLAKT